MKPRRSILSVPGHIEKMHKKASQSHVDVVMLDLEDSVPLDEKKMPVPRLSNHLIHWIGGRKPLLFELMD